ncbi:MAG: protein kinase domain-containing protein [Blastocatellia bacterium]
METKKISGEETARKTQVVTPFGTAPILVAPSLKQTGYDGELLKNRYLVEGELGRGGIGVVYLARDTQLMNRRVVVKVLLEDSTNAMHNPWFKKKFEQEIEALVRLDHPGIVGVLDAGTMPDGKEFFVMQYVEGNSLRKLVSGQMAFAQVARIVRQIGQALNSAHDKGIVHRDLKPENIMVQVVSDNEEMVKLIDFGIASVKDSKVATNAEKTKVAGALPYMAPEQLRGQPEASSDIWALGAMAYEMLTGRLPFYAETLVQLYEMQKRGLQASPRSLRADISPAVESILFKSMAFDPAERYQRAKDLGEDLARALMGDMSGTAPINSQPSTAPVSAQTSESPAYGTMATHSARTEVGAGIQAHTEAPIAESKPKSPVGKIAAAAFAVAVIAVAIWFATSKPKADPPPVVRQLSISSRVQQKGKAPLDVPGDVIFTPGDQLRLTFNSPEEGFLYIVNESPQIKNGLPIYNFLFPEPERVAAGAPSLKAGRPLYIPSEQPPWFPIDSEQGTETLWLVWSDHSIPELEAARKWLKTDGGEVKDNNEIRAIQQFIDKHFLEAKPKVEQDEGHKILKGGKDGLLIYQMKLAHS